MLSHAAYAAPSSPLQKERPVKPLALAMGFTGRVDNNRAESKKRINLFIRKEKTMPILLLGLLMSIVVIILAYYHLVWPVFGIIAGVVFVIDLIAAIVLALDSKRRL